jgi:ACS family tartrate transporter-like MFS transporter
VALALVNLGLLFANTGTTLWLPQIVQGMGFSNLETGFVSALPYAVSLPAMFLWGVSSDRKDERVKHVALPAMVAAVGFLAASLQSTLFGRHYACDRRPIGVQPPYFSLIRHS